VSGLDKVMVTRHRDALEGQSLRVLGRLRRHGGTELLVVLPDGSKRMIPAAWTDAAPAGGDGCSPAATLGTVRDLLAACVLVSGLSVRAGQAPEQAARQSPCKEDDRAACPAQSAAGGGSAPPWMMFPRLGEQDVAVAVTLLARLIAAAAAAATAAAAAGRDRDE
jgi:hypothetical protein